MGPQELGIAEKAELPKGRPHRQSLQVTPNAVTEANRNRILIHVHGGGYVLGPGESGTGEAILLAGRGHFNLISIDYRMPPDFPYPAAMDDAMVVYREIVRTTDQKIAIFGTSTGTSLR